MRLQTAFCACALTLIFGLAHAQSVSPAPDGASSTAPVEADAAQSNGQVSVRSNSLRQLGVDYEVTLRGIQGSIGVPFAVRDDELVKSAALHLKYSYSPALLPDLSHIKVIVNGVTVATLPTDKENAGKTLTADVPIDARLISSHNWINLQLIGHYTRECEDPDHTSLWANIDRNSTLSLTTTPVALANDLKLLPTPFFDGHDTRRLELPFYFPKRPDSDTLHAAGIVSSWFGALAGYRGAVFPVTTTNLPATGNVVVFATPDSLPQVLGADGVAQVGEIRGPTVAVVTHPGDPNSKLLLVLGRNAAEQAQAATAIALRAPLQGPVAEILNPVKPAPRKPYDAPNWISSEHPVHFGDLVASQAALNVTGYHPDVIRVPLQLPPDLFVWRRHGIPVHLKYRYTVPDVDNKSALNVSINDAFVTTLPLDGHAYAESVPLRWLHHLSARGAMPVEQDLSLPTGPLSANSQLRFHYFFDRPQGEACKDTFPDVAGAIDADSTIDLSSFSHFMAMPNLAAFGNAGYPFTRLADLARTAIVLPDHASDADFSNVLTILGRLGASTGYPALDEAITSAAGVDRYADRDLLVLGSIETQPLLNKWRADLPVTDTAQQRRFGLSDWVTRKFPSFLSFDPQRTDLPTTAEVVLRPHPGDVMMMGFESPLKSGRSVVVIQARDPSDLGAFFDAWLDPDTLKDFQGSVVLLQDHKVTSLAGNQTYYVGHLPWWTWLRWYYSSHPLMLSLTVLGLCLLLALAARLLLRRQAAARLRQGGAK